MATRSPAPATKKLNTLATPSLRSSEPVSIQTPSPITTATIGQKTIGHSIRRRRDVCAFGIGTSLDPGEDGPGAAGGKRASHAHRVWMTFPMNLAVGSRPPSGNAARACRARSAATRRLRADRQLTVPDETACYGQVRRGNGRRVQAGPGGVQAGEQGSGGWEVQDPAALPRRLDGLGVVVGPGPGDGVGRGSPGQDGQAGDNGAGAANAAAAGDFHLPAGVRAVVQGPDEPDGMVVVAR